MVPKKQLLTNSLPSSRWWSSEEDETSSQPSLYDREAGRWRDGRFRLPYDFLKLSDEDEEKRERFRFFTKSICSSLIPTFVLSIPFFLASLPAIFLPAPGTPFSRGVGWDVVMIFTCDFVYGVGIAPLLFAGDLSLLKVDGNWKKAFSFFIPRWCVLVTSCHYVFYFSTRSSELSLHYIMFPFYVSVLFFPFIEVGAHWVSTEKSIWKSFTELQWMKRFPALVRVVAALLLAVGSAFIPISKYITFTSLNLLFIY